MTITTARRSLVSSAFHGAAEVLRSTVRERVARRLTPTVPAPRDSDPAAGYPEPEHVAPEREAVLPPARSAWASSDADSEDGTRG